MLLHVKYLFSEAFNSCDNVMILSALCYKMPHLEWHLNRLFCGIYIGLFTVYGFHKQIMVRVVTSNAFRGIIF